MLGTAKVNGEISHAASDLVKRQHGAKKKGCRSSLLESN
jgi:hypothetical protein